MSYISLRQGKVLYRTPSSNSEHGIYGNFFSSYEIAKLYIENKPGSKKVVKFKSTQNLKLLNFGDINTFKYLDKTLKGKVHEMFQQWSGYGLTELSLYDYKKRELCLYDKKAKTTPIICDQLLDTLEGEYGHKTLGKEFCKLGFDGYYLPEKYIRARDFQLLDEDVLFHKEYFICNSKEKLITVS